VTFNGERKGVQQQMPIVNSVRLIIQI